MYRPTFAIFAIGHEDEAALGLALETMGDLLLALVNINRRYMRRFPGQIPLLYEGGIRYERMKPAEGCEDDYWQDCVVCKDLRKADCEDLACYRVAELQERLGVLDAAPHVNLSRRIASDGVEEHQYHVLVRWPEGLDVYPKTVYIDDKGRYLEDPSRVLGMR